MNNHSTSEENRKALYQLHPGRWGVPVLIVIATALLITGLYVPVLKVVQLGLIKNEFSIWTGIQALHEEGHHILGLIVLFFSIIFPATKLLALLFVWCARATREQRMFLLHWLHVLGHWSMLDVFVVAIIIVVAKLSMFASAKPLIGIYIFGLAILLSMVSTFLVDRLALSHDD